MSRVNPIPQGLTSVTAQLSIDGAAEAIEFYKRAFGAEELMRAPDPSGKKIWHAEIRIGNAVIFVNDTFPEMGSGANPSQLWIYAANIDALWERALAAGCTVRMPMGEQFWGDRLGVVIDKWGNQWSLAEHVRDLSPAELQKAQDEMIAKMKK